MSHFSPANAERSYFFSIPFDVLPLNFLLVNWPIFLPRIDGLTPRLVSHRILAILLSYLPLDWPPLTLALCSFSHHRLGSCPFHLTLTVSLLFRHTNAFAFVISTSRFRRALPSPPIPVLHISRHAHRSFRGWFLFF